MVKELSAISLFEPEQHADDRDYPAILSETVLHSYVSLSLSRIDAV